MTTPALEARGLLLRYGERAVVDLDELVVERGSTLAIIGPNGAGKSTLLRLLHLIERTDEGSLSVNGSAVTAKNAAALRRSMTMVFQEPFLLDGTVFANIAYGMKVRHLDASLIEKRVTDYSLLLGINHLLPRRVRGLSGGEAHRVCIARALAVEPEMIFLDEPLASMDPPSRDLLSRELPRMFKGLRKTVVYVTQDRAQALSLGADRLAVMIDGRIMQQGAATEVLAHPDSEEVARFIGTENVWPGVVSGHEEGLAVIDVDGLQLEACSPLRSGEKVNACVRPEDLAVSLERPHDSRRNVIEGRIDSITASGPLCRLDISGNLKMVAIVTMASVKELQLNEGSPVWAGFKATSVHVMARE